jgi:hypothetical protein
VVVDSSPVKKPRAKMPKKIISSKQDAVDEMFDVMKLTIGEELPDAYAEALESDARLSAFVDSHPSVSPDPPSEARAIPKRASAKGGAAAKSRE